MSKRSKLVGMSLVAAAVLGGCKDKKAATTPTDGNLDTSIATVDPTLCDTNGKNIVTYDLNHDGRPDVWRLYKVEDEGGTKVEFLTCKQVDFDHNNKKDWVVAYNMKGNPLYEKADFDYDGVWDMSAVYDTKTLTVAEVERDTDFDGKFDVKEIYDTAGVLTSVRKDRNTDGKPDLWEQYKDTVLLGGDVDGGRDLPARHERVTIRGHMREVKRLR